jgi:hypothetical protein
VTHLEAKLVATKAPGAGVEAATLTVVTRVVTEETETITAAVEADALDHVLQLATTDPAEEMIAETGIAIVMTVVTGAVETMIEMAVVTEDAVPLESPARPS